MPNQTEQQNDPQFQGKQITDLVAKAIEANAPILVIAGVTRHADQEEGKSLAVLTDGTTVGMLLEMFVQSISSINIQVPDFAMNIVAKLAINSFSGEPSGLQQVKSINPDGSKETIFNKPTPEPEKPEQEPEEQAVS